LTRNYVVGIVGDEDGWSEETVHTNIDKIFGTQVKMVVAGGDVKFGSFAQSYAEKKGIPILIYYPSLKLPASKRNYSRNKKIVQNSDVLVAFNKNKIYREIKNIVAFAERNGYKVWTVSQIG
jgi:hypothetical protein